VPPSSGANNRAESELRPIEANKKGTRTFQTSVTIYLSTYHNMPEELKIEQRHCENFSPNDIK